MTTINGQPAMSYINGTTNAMPMQMQQPVNTQQMATAAASIPKYDPNSDPELQQMAGRVKYLQDSGAFDTPYTKAMKNHPILMGIASGMQSFGQGLSKQPYYTDNQSTQAALQGKQTDNAMNMLNPQNMMAAMYLKQMKDAMVPPTPNSTSLPSTIQTPGSNQSWNKTPTGNAYRVVK
jgi:hypothetical protein